MPTAICSRLRRPVVAGLALAPALGLLWAGSLFAADGLLPHAFCHQCKPALVWLHGASDLLIGAAYVAISGTLTYLVYRARRDIPFHWMVLAFGVFIVACGATHFMGLWTIWAPAYWLAGSVKVVTAIASVATAVALPPLVPKVLALIEAAKVSEERKRSLETANRQLEALYAKTRELDELKTRFFANVSHELRTPLALILGPTENLLAAEGRPEAERRELEVVARSARLLLKHVNDLLDVAKLDAGRMEIAYAEVDLARLARVTAAHFDGLARERRIAFSVEVPPTLPAQVDPEKLERVLLNLLSNAFKFTPSGGAVRCVLVATADGWASLAVRDSGPGVAPALRGAIFERFRQGDGGATRSVGGTGLGLAIVKEFTELHGGRVAVGETPEGGAAFTVTLPLAAPRGFAVRPAEAEAAPAASELVEPTLDELRAADVATPAPATGAERGLVLVVEDQPDMRAFLAETLAGEYRVATAADGREGLAKVLALRPDLILSDVMMPGLSGEQLLREVRARKELAAVPFVVLTAKADDESRVRLLREGAQDYLMKPFAAEELRARVGNQVAMKRALDLLQQELASQRQDLEPLVREVVDRKREAQEAVRARDEFLSVASHELKTPLTPMQLSVQFLLSAARKGTLATVPHERIVSMLESAERQGRRFAKLIEALLDVTQIDAGRLEIELAEVDFSEVVRDVLARFDEGLKRSGSRVTLHAEAPVVGRWDRTRLEQVVANLLSNALKYGDRKPIEVAVEADAATARLTVRDQGIGIAAEHHARIFERFERAVPARNYGGLGLGLYIVRRILDALDGTVRVMSEPGAGSTFTVELPRRGPADAKAIA